MYKSLSIGSIIAVLATSASVYGDYSSQQSPQYRSQQYYNSRMSSNDHQLVQRVQTKLNESGLFKNSQGFKIQVESGTVYIQTQLDGQKQKQELKQFVSDIPGVRDVVLDTQPRDSSHRYMTQNNGKQNQDQARYSNQNEYKADHNRQSYQNGNLTDQQLQKRVQDALSGGWFSDSYENVTVNVSNGVVTLNGSVRTQKDKTDVEQKVRNIDGVQDVRNQLRVGNGQNRNGNGHSNNSYSRRAGNRNSIIAMVNGNGNSVSDQDIHDKVKQELQGGWFADSYKNVTVDVEDGVVTITGIVESNDDVKGLESRISSINGVKLVRNNVNVSATNGRQAIHVTDDQIKRRVDDELKNSWWGNYPNVNVDVKDGVVILNGSVEAESDVYDIQDRLSDVPGIKVIRSNLKLKNQGNR